MKLARITVRLADEDRFHLEDGATTIMLKFLPPKLASETLMELVDQVAPGRYDLFYYPRSRHRRKRNIDMCFINFVDHPSAVLAGEHLAKELESSWVAVRQAGVQGFLPNIAYYVTKSLGIVVGHKTPCSLARVRWVLFNISCFLQVELLK
ncbi:unnamed protein product [Durusdinium trenchii]|uniref:Mei2-like C-terminal RNA recognition motif domain-containing protein n=1 Tax=Durusdinium trenchii TaxID=1381693 RepID=A0ABP0L2V6_9DINO